VSQPTIGDWIAKLRHRIIHMKGTSEETWLGDYWKVLKDLPQDAILTEDILEARIAATEPHTKARKRSCMAIRALCRVAQFNYDPTPFAGSYGIKSVKPRELVSDEIIVEWFHNLKNPSWRWYYGLLAAYGLRPHEAFRIDFDRLKSGDPVLAVEADTKTGFRLVWAFHPEWFTQFDLQNVSVPKINLNRSNTKIGNSATNYFRETPKIPFTLYTLRHCWAIRTIFYRLPDVLSAQQMGHSVDVHNRIYHRWIVERHHQAMYDSLIIDPRRPVPPLHPDEGKGNQAVPKTPIESPERDRSTQDF
jgi:integrase